MNHVLLYNHYILAYFFQIQQMSVILKGKQF